MKRYLLVLVAVVFALFPGSATAQPATDYAKVGDIADAQFGKPAVFGASGPNAFDASGLVQWSYKQVGVSLPRTVMFQYQVTRPIAISELRRGDLVFYGRDHVAIYLGDGMTIEASPREGPESRVWRTPVGPRAEARTYRQ